MRCLPFVVVAVCLAVVPCIVHGQLIQSPSEPPEAAPGFVARFFQEYHDGFFPPPGANAEPAPIAPLTARLCGTMKALLDAMNEGAIYAERLNLGVSSEDLRALAVTAYIQETRGGAR